MSETKITGEEWIDVGMGWRVRWETSEHWLDFKAYEAISETLSGPDAGQKQFWEDPDKLSASPLNADVSKCKPTLEGFVKWDGCAEIGLDRQHFCGARDVAEFCEVLKALHRLALKIPAVDHECADYPVPNESEGK